MTEKEEKELREKEKERIEEGWIRIGGMEPLPTTRPIKPIEPPEPIRRRRRIRRRIRIRMDGGMDGEGQGKG